MNEIEEKKDGEVVLIDENLSKDFTRARDVYLDMIDSGSEAVKRLTTIADESEHPRAFEVLATLIRTTGDVADKLIGLHQAAQSVLPENPKTTKEEEERMIFSGTPEELKELLKDEEQVH